MMGKKVDKRCIECANQQGLRWRRQDKPDCYDKAVCGRKRSYYANHEANKSAQVLRHRYLKHRQDRCVVCHSCVGLEVHHIIPQGSGGLDAVFNLITLCAQCHKIITKYYSGIGQ